jgi:cytochrome c oxidase cbb3-type subunit 1
MVTYGTFYFLVPRLVGRELYSSKLANWHFVMALAGTLLYILAMWAAGVSQGLLWLSTNTLGEPSFAFRDIMSGMKPYYAMRLFAGIVFWLGTLMMVYNLWRTITGARVQQVAVPPVPEQWRFDNAVVTPAAEVRS